MTSIRTKGTSDSKVTAKKQRKGKSEPELVIPDAWINELGTIDINDIDWRCSVVLIEEACTETTVYLELFNETANNGNRLAVKVISQTELVEFVKKNILKEQSKIATPLDLLCKQIYTEVGPDFEKSIPTSLLAHLLKYIILEYKQLNKHIRNSVSNKNKELEGYEESLWPTSNIKTASSKSGKTGNKSEVSGKSGVGKTKAFTKLRKRGEEWKDKIWIDDAPIDGPQLYVAISRFYDSSLPLELLNLQVPLDAIVELSNGISPVVSSFCLTNSDNKHSNGLNYKSKRPLSDRDKRLQEKKKSVISKFWKEIDLLKGKLPTSVMFKNVMFLKLVPSNLDSECETEVIQEEIYRHVSHFMYDIFENAKLHKAYLDALDIIDVTDDLTNESPNMQVYNSVLDRIPHESLTIACVLDAILIQVCSSKINEDNEKEKEEEEDQIVYETSNSIIHFLQKLNIEYDLFQEAVAVSDADFAFASSPKHNFASIRNILTFSDDIRIKTFHLKKEIENLITIRTKDIIKNAWIHFWIKYFVPHDTDNNFIRLCNSIITSDSKCDNNVLCYYTYILIVNCILDSVLMSSNFLPPEPIGRPTIYSTNKTSFPFRKPDLCEDCLHDIGSAITIFDSSYKLDTNGKCTESSLTSGTISSPCSLTAEIIASNLFYIEDMPSDIMVQHLQSDFNRFNQFETRYCPSTEQLIVVFHNLFSLGDVWEESWFGKLTTNVPERDFVEYILEEEVSWLNSYINKTQGQSLMTQTSSFVPRNEELGMSSLPDSNFISHRSLKYDRLRNKEQMLQKASPLSTKSGFDDSCLKTYDMKNEEYVTGSGLEDLQSKEINFNKAQKKFTGYNLGESQRIQFNGSVKEKLFEDNTKITIKKVNKLYGDESNTMHVTVNGHTLYYNYKVTSSSISPFHMVLSSGIILYFGHPGFQVNKKYSTQKNGSVLEPLPELVEYRDINSRISETIKLFLKIYDSIKFPLEFKEADFHEIPLIYDFKMSTPSGLHVEFVKPDHKDLLYVRQKLFSKCYKSKFVEQEEFRCCTSSGYIMKFMVGGGVELLGGDGAIYTIYEVKQNMGIDITSTKDFEDNDRVSLASKIEKAQKKKDKSKNSKSKRVSKTEEVLKTSAQELQTESHLIVNYKYTTSDGKRYVVEDSRTERIEDVLTISSIDISKNCIHSERLDGLTSTHHADGSLTVYFPDGSCITSTPFETGEVFCEWSNYELDLWFTSSENDITVSKNPLSITTIFPNEQAESDNSIEEPIPHSQKHSFSKSSEGYLLLDVNNSSILKTSQKSLFSGSHKSSLANSCDSKKSVESGGANSRKNKIIYSKDGFVVYNLNYLMEHPNYSSVYYDHGNREVEFKLPFSTSVTLKKDGSYKAMFEGANLLIKNDEVFFNKLNDSGNITRTVVINTVSTIQRSNNEFKTKVNVAEHFDEKIFKSLRLEMQKQLLNFHNLNRYLLYTVNELGNQMFVDFDLNVFELLNSKAWHGVRSSDFSCSVIGKDLGGFRLVSNTEADEYIQIVVKHHGLVRKSKNTWSSLLTSLPVFQNESQKWFMERNGSKINAEVKSNVSTFGRRESWTKPFVEKETTELNLIESDVVIARILHKIPREESVLAELKVAIETCKICTTLNPNKITTDSTNGKLNLIEIINDPSILHQIYEEERPKAIKENDKFRNNIKNTFLLTLVRQACIKARKTRQLSKVEEFKRVLKTKNIPPYHLSCFGQVHDALDEVLLNVNALRKTPSKFLRVTSIIDEILNLAITDTQNDADKVTSTSDTNTIRAVVSEIFGNFCDVSREKSFQNLISSILEKPLVSVTDEEIKLLSQAFHSGSGDCPILYDEELVLQDVLEARFQLSHYFGTLKELLQFYRNQVSPQV